jgi:diguanylate cyclase (GGDEF)-like protein
LTTALFGSETIPVSHAERIWTARRALAQRLSPAVAIFTGLSSLSLLSSLELTSSIVPVLVWCLAGLGLVVMRRLTDAPSPQAAEGRDSPGGAVLGSALAAGVIWGGLFALILSVAGADDGFLMGVLAAGMLLMGFAMYPASSRAQFAYSAGPLAAIALASVGANVGAAPLLVAVSAAFLTQRLGAVSSDLLVRREIAGRALEDASDTIGVVLHDIEPGMSDWLWRLTEDGRLEAVSERFAEAAGVPAEALEGASFLSLLSAASAARLKPLLAKGRAFRDLPVEVTVGARTRWWLVSGRPDGAGCFRGVCSDLSASEERGVRVAHITGIDALTGLPNRVNLMRRLQEERETGQTFVLFCVDIDGFKAINDSLGHALGDEFLKIAAERILDAVDGRGYLARTGADEFAVIVPGLSDEEAGDASELIVDALLAPIYVGGRSILAGGSVGFAIGPRHGESPDDLMKNAELALSRAKHDGKGCARMFEDGMAAYARRRADLAAELRTALRDEAMEVYFQPLVNPHTGHINSYEALMRWNRPGKGPVSPGEFIECAEETGVIVPLGEWVIRRAVMEAAQWRDEVGVAVNLSPTQMKDPALLSTIVSALATAGLEPSRLEVEITESVLMQETEQTFRTLHAIKGLGIKIALDDFGTGFSSLSYLRAFPFDKLKIDRSFVLDIETSREAKAVIRAVVTMARDLGMRVTAEGVEDLSQVQILSELGCDDLQGYYYARPAPGSGIPKRVAPLPSPGDPDHTPSLRALASQAG